jgi:D-alanyl-lipoteichoic acid acyltransferase DltB (MBOAT superfamily)
VFFNSFDYLLFFPTVFLLYWFVFQRNLLLQNGFLLIASYFFYGWWSWEFTGLLFLSTLIDFSFGFWVASPDRKKAKLFLILSILNNLGLLALFKYYNFFAEQIEAGFAKIGWECHPILLNVALPIGISFYTFHGMSYVFDIYRGQQKPTKNFIDYSVFVSFFPLLVAGPIERANHLLPQVQKKRNFSDVQWIEGARLILWGLFKKVVIADSLAVIANQVFSDFSNQSSFMLILGAIAFSFQIYGDFSGYSDIAIGSAKLLGFELLSNFKFPYFSRNIAEFWRRWHVSLSSWFRDYLYIPLGGSKSGTTKAFRNTYVIFLVSGFWHGASWNFIIWGFIHACFFLPLLLLHQNRKYTEVTIAENRYLPNLKEIVQVLFTFSLVTLAWIFFRQTDSQLAIDYVKRMVVNAVENPEQFKTWPKVDAGIFWIIPFIVYDWINRRNERVVRFPRHVVLRWFMYVLMIFFIFLFSNRDVAFIYFQF